MTNDYLFTMSPPRVQAGCGGIDLFAGGISFLDPEYLVEKFENILQAAPALAFSMALKAHCETCEDVMNKLEATSSFLNSIQVNDCRMANQVAKLVTGDNPEFFENVLEEATGSRSLEDAVEKHYHGAQQSIRDNDGAVPVDLKDEIDNCPAGVKEFIKTGHIIQHAADKVGMTNVASLVRGYIGDVSIDWSGNAPSFVDVDPCPGNDRFSSYDFLMGEAQGRDNFGICSSATGVNVLEMVRDTMGDIGDGIRAKRELTEDEINFINQSALPVYEIVRTGLVSGNLDQAISAYEYPIASSLAFRIFDDLLMNVDFILVKSINVTSVQGVNSSSTGPDCNMDLVAPAKAKLERLKQRLQEARESAFHAYRVTVAEQHSLSAQAALFLEEKKRYARGFLKGQAE